MPALRRHDGVEVVAITGSTAGQATAIARTLGIPTGCGSVAELIEQGLDAVSVAMPPDRQAEAVAAILGAGLPVLAEKPLAISVAEAEELVRRAEGLPTAIDFEFAELATFRALRRVIATGDYGDVLDVHVEWLTRPRTPHPEGSWKRDPGRGGGALALLGSHVLYLLEWLFGPIDGLVARGSLGMQKSPLVLTCRVESGATVTVSLDNESRVQRHQWRIVFEDATVTASNTGVDAVRGFRLTSDRGAVLARERKDAHPDGRVALVASLSARFVAAVRAGGSMSPDFAAGLRVQRLLAQLEGAVAL